MSGDFELSVEGPGLEPLRRTLERARCVIIGRDPTCDVVLRSPAVSREHLEVWTTPEGVRLVDRSANGTLVGPRLLHLAETVVRDVAEIRVGPYLVRLTSSRRDPIEPCASPELRRQIHRRLIDHLDLAAFDRGHMGGESIRSEIIDALTHVLSELEEQLPKSLDSKQLVDEMVDEVLGLGPLQSLLEDEGVSEIMVVDPETIYIERRGKIAATSLRFTDDEACRAAIERIVAPLGRRIDESTPIVDARLPDGSRVNAIIPPLAIRGPCITIRKFPAHPLDMDDLVRMGSLSPDMAGFLERCVLARKNLLISGGTGSGKTTLLNVLSSAIPDGERIVTIEDAAELRLQQSHVVSLEARPPNLEGRGGYTIRELVKNSLRMRPDRIVVGECRGAEAIDMLQAMNTGHEGSMTTTHANSPVEALSRVQTLCMMAGLDLPQRAIRQQIACSIHLVIQQARFHDGSRRITAVSEVDTGSDDELLLRDIFEFERTGVSSDGKVLGEFRATGHLPSFLDDFISLGLVRQGTYL